MSQQEYPSYRQRLALVRNKTHGEWWFTVFGGPLGNFIAAAIAEIRWITPNSVTFLSCAARAVGSLLIIVEPGKWDYLACALLQLGIILDTVDGAIARYRKQSSALGAFLDKTVDAVVLLLLGAVLGIRTYWATGNEWYLLAGMFIGASFFARCYWYWLARYFQLEADSSKKVSVTPFGDLRFGQRIRFYLRSTWMIVNLGESDIHFFVGIGLLFGFVEDVTLPIVVVMAFWFMVLFFVRVRAMHVLDLERAEKAEKSKN